MLLIGHVVSHGRVGAGGVRWGGALAMALVFSAFVRAEVPQASQSALDWIEVSADGTHFVANESGTPFASWGLNCDRDSAHRLLEDHWLEEWSSVVEDFREM